MCLSVILIHPDVILEIGINSIHHDIEVDIQLPDSMAVDYPLNHTKIN